MINHSLPMQNRILKSLQQQVQGRLFPKLEMLTLKKGSVLHEAAATLSYVYFPIDTIVSLLHVLEDGTTAEVAIIGNEGMIGVSAIMGGNNTPSQAIVLTTGTVCRLSAQQCKDEFNQSDAILRMLLLRYSQALITQMAQTVVCNRHHTIDQQLPRWLLMAADRLPMNDIIMTHELIASMLGVRREGITAAAHKLKDVGAIEYHRGHIRIVDRIKLEKLSCECYLVVKQETERLLPSCAHRRPDPLQKTTSKPSGYAPALRATTTSKG
ncbi:MAG: Crp/Fnr family transcriptional regulator [Gammaproteobacteria bacterium]